ncbi:HNH endonuclease [Crocosphaera sp. Alani8]|uniref:HNH endonuclease n=1 Tax=Crocosphaera sp. Alani8 TaxID=3038952 RepID=UPI00313ED721
MIKDINYYRQKFSPRPLVGKMGLNVSRNRGTAPNKPILILSIIELIERGKITRNKIYLTPELIATFLKLWSHLEIDRNPDIGLPFYHLRSDGFWHFKANLGFEFIENPQSKVKVRTIKNLKEAVDYAYFDPELFILLSDSTFRSQLTLTLIDSWFSDKPQQIRRSLSVDALEDLENQLIASGGKVYQPQEIDTKDEQTIIVRDGAFRKAVTSIYGYRCAFCELQVFNNQENIVDGAHIKPFSQFYDDRIINGLSLCKNHHWAFDRFWFTINDDYTIELAETLHEDSPYSTPMSQFQGKRLWLPNNQRYHPSAESLAWHRESFLNKYAS